MSVRPVATTDLVDEYGTRLEVPEVRFRQLGGRRSFAGPVRTVACHEDNGLLRELLRTPGEGAGLVVDGRGSLRSALIGDVIAGSAVASGWAGVVVYGAVRDSAAPGGLDLGVMALGTIPRESSKAGEGSVGTPVAFGGVTFRPGRILRADDDGIVLLPAG
ncbi:ribonuclease E activity regulator RraA [Streptomyces sp. SCSIO ZS0520]|uniref:ribonuclease E activity regulator RraA n=1 Tax=Streptomyces sp. SCSIO ZS0520 TaxID=2892996 RepID=UPI0021DAAFA4|nr:ribonuclease E activity regulator RraA [Streptomyces sp. SCSIO ZS0520]